MDTCITHRGRLSLPPLLLGRRKLLEARGWRVVSVPFYHWSGVDEEGRQALLKRLLAEAREAPAPPQKPGLAAEWAWLEGEVAAGGEGSAAAAPEAAGETTVGGLGESEDGTELQAQQGQQAQQGWPPQQVQQAQQQQGQLEEKGLEGEEEGVQAGQQEVGKVQEELASGAVMLCAQCEPAVVPAGTAQHGQQLGDSSQEVQAGEPHAEVPWPVPLPRTAEAAAVPPAQQLEPQQPQQEITAGMLLLPLAPPPGLQLKQQPPTVAEGQGLLLLKGEELQEGEGAETPRDVAALGPDGVAPFTPMAVAGAAVTPAPGSGTSHGSPEELALMAASVRPLADPSSGSSAAGMSRALAAAAGEEAPDSPLSQLMAIMGMRPPASPGDAAAATAAAAHAGCSRPPEAEQGGNAGLQ